MALDISEGIYSKTLARRIFNMALGRPTTTTRTGAVNGAPTWREETTTRDGMLHHKAPGSQYSLTQLGIPWPAAPYFGSDLKQLGGVIFKEHLHLASQGIAIDLDIDLEVADR